MKYLDNSLEDNYDKIVSVRWTTLYSEHGSGFRQEGAGCSGSVPFIVSRKGHHLELNESQQEQIEPSVRQFYLLDLSRYFREKSSEWLPKICCFGCV